MCPRARRRRGGLTLGDHRAVLLQHRVPVQLLLGRLQEPPLLQGHNPSPTELSTLHPPGRSRPEPCWPPEGWQIT